LCAGISTATVPRDIGADGGVSAAGGGFRTAANTSITKIVTGKARTPAATIRIQVTITPIAYSGDLEKVFGHNPLKY
jgi:hypothetical protein